MWLSGVDWIHFWPYLTWYLLFELTANEIYADVACSHRTCSITLVLFASRVTYFNPAIIRYGAADLNISWAPHGFCYITNLNNTCTDVGRVCSHSFHSLRVDQVWLLSQYRTRLWGEWSTAAGCTFWKCTHTRCDDIATRSELVS